MRQKISWKRLLVIALSVMMLAGFLPGDKIQAAQTAKYGVLIGDKNGKYKFYDLNGEKGDQRILLSPKKNIMVPLKLLTSYMPDIDYSFDFATNKATLKNKKNGRKLVLTKNTKTAYSYTKNSSRKTKRTMTYKMYIDSASNAAVAHISALKWVMADANGYKYFKKADIRSAGYDAKDFSGIIVYNPYKKVTSLPAADKVTYAPRKLAANVVKVTIPEGYSVAQIFKKLTDAGVCVSSKALYKAADKLDLTAYELTAQREDDENRCFDLEGYLYPDTYEFYRNSVPADVLKTMLSNTEKKLTTSQRDRAAQMGMTEDEVLTLASIVEKECGVKEEREKVASVFLNRLKTGMKLQSDATIHYVEKYVKPYISGDKDQYNSYYNTYKCPALPAGPICNPGKSAIDAVLYPAETEYLFFLTDADGRYYYAVTYEEHLKNAELAGLNTTEE
ncbi:endolytic transglycosylase MltG [Anaerolentibacter hominis]|uniref:endolytic transglycosylase MltG n=1 Tax=Anaerolentibacter hominis TaxID=3079009 RepID=UPI0031B896CD